MLFIIIVDNKHHTFKILGKPQSVKSLARLFLATMNPDPGISGPASHFLHEVEELERPLEALKAHPKQSAIEALTNQQNRLKWIDALEKHLAKLDDDPEALSVSTFTGSPRENEGLNQTHTTLEVFRRVFQLPTP